MKIAWIICCGRSYQWHDLNPVKHLWEILVSLPPSSKHQQWGNIFFRRIDLEICAKLHHSSSSSLCWKNTLLRTRMLIFPLVFSLSLAVSCTPGFAAQWLSYFPHFVRDLTFCLFTLLYTASLPVKPPHCTFPPHCAGMSEGKSGMWLGMQRAAAAVWVTLGCMRSFSLLNVGTHMCSSASVIVCICCMCFYVCVCVCVII